MATAILEYQYFVLPQLQELFVNQFENGSFQRLWWIQGEAPAVMAKRERLTEVFHNRLVTLQCEPKWPPRSLDLTPCNFFLLIHMKF